MWTVAIKRFLLVGVCFVLSSRIGAASALSTRIGGAYGLPPLVFVDGEGPEGFSLELLDRVLALKGVAHEVKEQKWTEALGALREGQVDVLPVLSRTLEREPVYDFTIPYLSVNCVMVARETMPAHAGLESLADMKVALLVNGLYEEYLRHHPELRVECKVYNTCEEMLEAVALGDCAVALLPEPVAYYYLSRPQWAGLEVGGSPINELMHEFRFAVREGDRELLDALNEGLVEVRTNGEQRRLYRKWLTGLQMARWDQIVVACNEALPPWSYLDADGLPAGFNVDLVHALAREIGVKVRVECLPWNACLSGLKNQEIDLVMGMAYSQDRETFVFSNPYEQMTYVGVTSEQLKRGTVDSLADLKGLRVAAAMGTIIYDELARQEQDFELTGVTTFERALLMVETGLCDCAVVPRRVAIDFVEKLESSDLKIGADPIFTAEYGLAAYKGNHALISAVNEGLDRLRSNGTYRKLYSKWLRMYDSRWVRMNRWMVSGMIVEGVALGIILLLGGWLWLVRRQVRSRTRELKRIMDHQQVILSSVPLAIYSVDLNRRVTFWNDGAERMFGWAESEVLGGELPFVKPEKLGRLQEMIEETLRHGFLYDIDSSVVRKDGVLIEVRSTLAVLRDSKGEIEGVISMSQDITERLRARAEKRELQGRLNQMQKMESLGQLAAGITHDFNNILQVIYGFADLGLGEVSKEDRVHDDLLEIINASQRATILVKQLLAFSRQQVLDLKTVDLNEVIADVVKILRRVIGEDVTLSLKLALEAQEICVDVGQIGQILINLCVNARDAMPDGGRIVIATSTKIITRDDLLNIPQMAPGTYVVLSLSDTGTGIPPAVLPKIFDPFFTTKATGKGTGLGLSTVFGIVQQHNGFIYAESKLGVGTTFHVYLPVADATTVRKSVPVPLTLPEGKGRILIAEDNTAALRLASLILEDAGYTVYAASDGKEALEIFGKYHDSIDLVVLDVIMPELNGCQLYKRLCEIKPGIPVIFTSAYSNGGAYANYIQEEQLPLLQKPYQRSELLQQVHRVLNQKDQESEA